jgi:hypothetical protein
VPLLSLHTTDKPAAFRPVKVGRVERVLEAQSFQPHLKYLERAVESTSRDNGIELPDIDKLGDKFRSKAEFVQR